LNEEEKKAVAQWRERNNKAPQSPIVYTFTKDDEGNPSGGIETVSGYPVSPTDKFELAQAAINLATGSINYALGQSIYSYCVAACGIVRSDKNQGQDMTSILSAMQALKPQDEIEGMLVSRLIALHFKGMQLLWQASLRSTDEGIGMSINSSTKLSRLYNETLETLMRYRRKGEQKVVVQHVQVNDGGKAVVNGHMQSGGAT